MRASRVVWALLVPFCVALAVSAVYVMVRENVGGAEEATGNTVTMRNINFSPETLIVRPGTVVVFDNADVAPHTVTADDDSTDSGILDPGQTYRLTVDRSFSYHCVLHPAMQAEIRVEG